MSSNLTDIWTCGDLGQKKKIQNLVFPSGLGTTSQMEKFEPRE